ncbi:Retrovirus-related Pol polyprotein from transposon TNT 1-94 [Vitis vinifera]|uniref:Retrovirus-related Pol polyprotein from transposon TNT 1-94 n=1 Tax=Vitis vinifera TaxID=29760 RepID=A0A438D4G5_VITVI|nr:Retrovirus-related Pol polyprotein from transposon TNT 1-94 [Vitis vinifera]
MVVFMVLYVDDIMFIGNDVELLSLVKIQLSAFFQMKNLGDTQDILRIKFLKDCKNRKSLLSQATYIDKLLIKYVMQDSKKGLLSLRYPTWLANVVVVLKKNKEVEDVCRLHQPQ